MKIILTIEGDMVIIYTDDRDMTRMDELWDLLDFVFELDEDEIE